MRKDQLACCIAAEEYIYLSRKKGKFSNVEGGKEVK